MNTQLYLRQQFHQKVRPLYIKEVCECCGETENLELHHKDIQFIEILEESLELLDLKYKEDTNEYTKQELELLGLVMIGKQIRSKYLTVCYDCHVKIHNEEGFLKRNQINKREKEKKLYAESVLSQYLETILGMELFKEEQQYLKKKFINGNIKDRSMGINSLNSLLSEMHLPYKITSKRDEKRSIKLDDGTKIENPNYKKTFWMIDKLILNKENQL